MADVAQRFWKILKMFHGVDGDLDRRAHMVNDLGLSQRNLSVLRDHVESRDTFSLIDVDTDKWSRLKTVDDFIDFIETELASEAEPAPQNIPVLEI